jgi:hypothetical protein
LVNPVSRIPVLWTQAEDDEDNRLLSWPRGVAREFRSSVGTVVVTLAAELSRGSRDEMQYRCRGERAIAAEAAIGSRRRRPRR